MRSSQTRCEGNHVSARTPASDVAGPHHGAHDRHVQAEFAWTDLPDDEFEAVS